MNWAQNHEAPGSLSPRRRTPQEWLSQSSTPYGDNVDLSDLGSPKITRDPANAAPFNPTPSFGQSLNNGMPLLLGCLYLLGCVATACWMLAGGPKPVPRQDTRITNAIISIVSRVALTVAIWILTVLLRLQWTQVLISGRLVKLRGLLIACGDMGILSRVRYLSLMPTRIIGITTMIGLGVTICMTLTSAAFKYVVIPGTGMSSFIGPDFASLCNYSLVTNVTGYFCSGNSNDLSIQWNYLDAVNGGAGGNVLKSNNTSGLLSANVTLTSAPADIRLPSNPPPPWAAINVGCTPVDMALEQVGTGALANTSVIVNGYIIDELDVANMPTWYSQVMYYQQVNDSGPASSLSPYYMVLLSRDLNDGTANIQGLAGSAVDYFGAFYLDLHGYGPVIQGVLGAAAYCNFSGSTGGDWPDISWPARNTTNYFVGNGPENGTVGVATLFLNYGPSWQYTPTQGNSIPGGTVSFIANFTTEASTFPEFIAAYIRNQWALMMYANNFITPLTKNTSYEVQTEPSIHIQATAILVIPVSALVFCVGCAAVGVLMMRNLGAWYKCVDNAPWWLLKVVNATPGLVGEVNEDEFQRWAEERHCRYAVNDQDAARRRVLELQ